MHYGVPEGLCAFGLSRIGLELAIQCALEVESWFPGCEAYALDCGIDAVFSYQRQHKRNTYSRRRYYAVRRLGLCFYCGKPADGGRCIDCRDKELSAQRKRYAWRRANGLCVQCGEPAIAGKKCCERHAEQNRVQKLRKRQEVKRGQKGQGKENFKSAPMANTG